MMATLAKVVIGANYGDEGKGVMTDYFTAAASGNPVLTVRFNGGAQAGHTVVTPEGKRHVCSHFGAGSLAGATTYLSRFFVVNPILFFKEADHLAGIGARPEVLVSPDAVVTTPGDMMINQVLEEARGGERHGSCGVGFGETIERNLHPRFALTVADLTNQKRLTERLKAIQQEWIPERLRQLGIPCDPLRERLDRPGLWEHFKDDCEAFSQSVRMAGTEVIARSPAVVFEGAQGLLLDQERGDFPHVTRSYTGLRNVLALMWEAGLTTLEVFYVTRTYLTRHGAGPLAGELSGPPCPGVADATNIFNPYQGALRFAWLNADRLKQAVMDDLNDALGVSVVPSLVVTCMDQLSGPVNIGLRDRLVQVAPDEIPNFLSSATELPVSHLSVGPDRRSVLPV